MSGWKGFLAGAGASWLFGKWARTVTRLNDSSPKKGKPMSEKEAIRFLEKRVGKKRAKQILDEAQAMLDAGVSPGRVKAFLRDQSGL